VVTCLFSRQLLSLFGADYGRYGSTLLIALVLSTYPNVINSITVSVLRLRRRLARAAALNLSIAVAYLAGSWFTLPHLGISGAGWAHLVAEGLGTAAVVLVIGYDRVTAKIRHTTPGSVS